MPDAAASLAVLRRAAAVSPDGRSVALVFGTHDFDVLLTNWACHALAIGIRWFVLVAFDEQLHASLSSRSALAKHVVLHNISINKLTVIGERQKFGLKALEAGLNVVHSDADALWLRDPFPLLAEGDVVAERIWGKPLSVVRAWGAGICTGFYFLRSTPAVRALARSVRDEIARKRKRQPTWQASDQYFVNVVLHRHGVAWRGGVRMAGMEDVRTRFYDPNATHGVVHTPKGRLRLVMLAHSVVPRACPVLSSAEMQSLAAVRAQRARRPLGGKARLWQRLRASAHVLHCFPPGGDPEPGEARRIFMGHPKHTRAEILFAQRQGLWRVGEGGACAPRSAQVARRPAA